MADFAQKYDLDLRFGGSTLGDFAYFYDVELPYIYKCLNSLRRNQVSPAGESLEPAAHMFKVEDDKLYIRDSDNQSWIFLLDLAYRGGLYEQGQRLLKNTDLAGDTAEARANKVAVYDSAGNIPSNITGSASKIADKQVMISGIEDGQTLSYSAATNSWIPADRFSSVGEGKTLTLRDSAGVIGLYNGGAAIEVDIPVSGLLPNTAYAYGAMVHSIQLPTNMALICTQAGTTSATIPTLSDQDLYTIGTAKFQRVSTIPRNVLLRNQSVTIGEIRFTDKIPSNYYLECTTAGATADTFPSFVGISDGATISDGTVVWTARKQSGSATKLETARTINGTSFDGSQNITTAQWGISRNFYIASSDGTNAGAAVAVNGGGNATLKLPSAIKANITGNVTGNASGSSGSCAGNAATATKVNGKTILTVTSFSNGVLNLSTFS